MRSVPGWIVAWVVAGVTFAIALVVPNVRLPSSTRGLRSFQVPIEPNISVSQTFTLNADGLHAVEFAPARTGAASGSLRLELHEEGSALVRSADVSAAEVASSPIYRFEFEPIPDSDNATYRLDLLSSESNPATGVAVWATKGEGARGTMLINDRERWADIEFATYAPAGRSSWQRLRAAAQPGSTRANVVIGAFAAYWCALGLVLRVLSMFGGAYRRDSGSPETARMS